MRVQQETIHDFNEKHRRSHADAFAFLKMQLEDQGLSTDDLLTRLMDLQVAIPSWALGAGGTRFGRFSTGGEPGNLDQKIEDVGLLHALTRSAGGISLHIPWDIPQDTEATKELAASFDLIFDAVNSNTFQDQKGQAHSYKFGSLCHASKTERQQAIDHNIEVIQYGRELGSKSITVWLADGSSFPGQLNFRHALERT
ncbi:MAG: sugar isomerase, partial [Saprospiraceae bacterium]|nr:sugar isomerase [Saprospiraceae bacterium]